MGQAGQQRTPGQPVEASERSDRNPFTDGLHIRSNPIESPVAWLREFAEEVHGDHHRYSRGIVHAAAAELERAREAATLTLPEGT